MRMTEFERENTDTFIIACDFSFRRPGFAVLRYHPMRPGVRV